MRLPESPFRRALAYLWAAPVTLIGCVLALVAVATGGRMAVRDGVIESHGGALQKLLRRGAAMTLGHVILARSSECMTRSRGHEWRHVRQYERWGPLLLPLAWIIGLRLRLKGLDPYLDHPFENWPDP